MSWLLPTPRPGWLAATLVAALATVSVLSSSDVAAAQPGPAGTCGLGSKGNPVSHVVNLVFDNVHFTRDDPNVPSDLEQMPNLLSFVESDGTLLSHEHTPLIAHTATDILTSATGVYGDHNGAPISNAFGFYDTSSFASFRSTFEYWTAQLGGKNDNTYYMTTAAGKNAPAPWVPFTRAGCSYGAVAAANQVLENPRFDIPVVFGPTSPEALELHQNSSLAATDFEGVAIHCGQGDTRCAAAAGARPDLLPDEPGGYAGYQALFGAKYVDPYIGPSGPLTDLDGNVIADSHGNPGFPGFDSMAAAVSLSWVAAMQEHGVPVTTAYLSDLHDDHATGHAFGPGEAGYVAALKAYDTAFGEFFARLAKDGITPANTLFTITSDENDHFVGGPPSDPTCDGITRPCTYPKIGELDASISGLLSAVPPYSGGATVPSMGVHNDSAPTIYLDGDLGQTDPTTRTMEQALKSIQAVSPITGRTDNVTNYLADQVEMHNLHMLTSDAARNPTMTLFADPDYYLCAAGFACPETGSQVVEETGFAWNHGDISPDINTTWLGLVGPGVKPLGVDGNVWSDHADDRPTELALVGLEDDYQHDGRVLAEVLQPGAVRGLGDADAYVQLAQVFKQIDAPVGQFGLTTVKISTSAMESGSSANDSVYTNTDQELQALGQARDQLASEMSEILDRPASSVVAHRDHDRGQIADLEQRGLSLLQQAWLLASE